MDKSLTQAGDQSATRQAPDALDFLRADHRSILELFEAIRPAAESAQQDAGSYRNEGAASRIQAARRACRELSMHAQMEEEILYPAVREAVANVPLVDHAEDDHANIKALIKQVESLQSEDPDYDATIAILRDEIERHVKEEETIMFACIAESSLDTLELGDRLMQRKQMLQAEMSGVKPS